MICIAYVSVQMISSQVGERFSELGSTVTLHKPMRDRIQTIFGLVTRCCPSRADSLLTTLFDISFTFRRMSFVDDSLDTPAPKFDKERKNASMNQCALHFALLNSCLHF
ncbi:hypothetical protein D915_007136 [Fasciola hepatica]|uniref:Uncharacterized protein n=1 Tax=Fasciola hepatica TaxID=6192 RepID=A0A4E0RZ41_FASHE|nr:hypothetical protein D915_007136 [Fasciola hepatica]